MDSALKVIDDEVVAAQMLENFFCCKPGRSASWFCSGKIKTNASACLARAWACLLF